MVCAVEGFESNESARHWARLVVTGDLVNMLPYILHKRDSNVGHAGSPYAKKGSVGRSTIGNSMQLCLGVPELVGVDPACQDFWQVPSPRGIRKLNQRTSV